MSCKKSEMTMQRIDEKEDEEMNECSVLYDTWVVIRLLFASLLGFN